MSMDTTDDLVHAEHVLASLAARGDALAADALADYCRPTCGADEYDDPADGCSDDWCGCPCHDRRGDR